MSSLQDLTSVQIAQMSVFVCVIAYKRFLKFPQRLCYYIRICLGARLEAKLFPYHLLISRRMAAFYVYDYFLHLSCEVDLMWRGKFQLGTVFYFAARYMPVFGLMYTLDLVTSDSPPP